MATNQLDENPVLSELMERLEDRCGADDMVQECLDEMVHDAASKIGSAVNNNGVPAQVKFIIEQFGLDSGMKALHELLEEL